MNKKIGFIFIVFFILLSSILSAQNKIKLRFSPAPGETLSYKVESLIKSDASNLFGNDMSMNASSSGDINLFVERLTANNIYTKLTSDDLLVTIQSPSNTSSFNLATVEGKAVNIVFNRTGKVDEIKNLNALKKQNLMNFSIIQVIRNYFPTFPDKPVGIGDSWSDNNRMSVPFQGMNVEVLLITTYTLDSIVNSQAGQEASVSVEYIVSLQGTRQFGQGRAELSGKGSGSGYLHFLVSKGYFTEYNISYEIEASVDVKSKDQTVLKIPVQLSATASLLKY
ncbi:MAG: hypothetical protein JW737_05225 [Acidobacteria bacterium]|nr:hypothetical protein [Acidobacteriota bacterium]